MAVQLKRHFMFIYQKPINGNLLYFISFCGILFLEFIFSTTFNTYIPIKLINWSLDLLMIPVLFKIFFLDNYKWWQVSLLCLALIIAFFSWKKSGLNNLFIMVLMILGARGVNFTRLIKSYFQIITPLLLLVIFYSLIGVIQNLVYHRGETIRYALGINYPTDLAAYVFSLTLAYCYLNYKKLNWLRYMCFTFFAGLIFYFTDSRLDTLLVLLIIPVMYVATKAQKNFYPMKIIASFYWTVIPFSAFAVLYGTAFFAYDNKIYMQFDNLLSGRLHLGNQAIHQYGYTLLGQKVTEHGWGGIAGLRMMRDLNHSYFFIDSAYLRLFLIFGVLMGIIFLAFALYISITNTRNGKYILPGIIFLVAVSGIIDQHMLELNYNPFMLAMLSLSVRSFRNKNGKN